MDRREQKTIAEAWVLRRAYPDIITDGFVNRLHKRVSGHVWHWEDYVVMTYVLRGKSGRSAMQNLFYTVFIFWLLSILLISPADAQPDNVAVRPVSAAKLSGILKAVSDKNVEELKSLLKKGANPNVATEFGETPLMLTVQSPLQEN